MSENLKFITSYDKNTKTILISTNLINFGPTVTNDQAKLVAFETYHIKKINSVTLRILNEIELKQRPEDTKDTTPVYYVIEVTDEKDQALIIYVSSNKREHNFILK
jgi:hypothetical protein